MLDGVITRWKYSFGLWGNEVEYLVGQIEIHKTKYDCNQGQNLTKWIRGAKVSGALIDSWV